MDLSIIYELETNDNTPAGIRRVYDETTEQIKLADTLGFRTVWFTEHHFLDRFSYSSAPESYLAYLAGQTKNIRLGHGITLRRGSGYLGGRVGGVQCRPRHHSAAVAREFEDAPEDVDPGDVQLGQRLDQDS